MTVLSKNRISLVAVALAAGFGLAGCGAAPDSAAGGAGPDSVARGGCDRDCLGDIMSAFLDSLVANDPSIAPLADNVRFTEDTLETPIGEGFWATASALGDYRTDFLDVREQTAAVHALMQEGGMPVLFAARLKVENREIIEIETMVVRGAAEAMLFAPEQLTGPSAAFNTMPPADRLLPREEMIEIARRYPEGLRVGSFVTADAPFAPDAYRLENGVRMAGPGCTFQPPSCEDMLNQTVPTLAEMDGYVVAVDEQNGAVLMRLDFGRGSLFGGGGGEPQVLVTFEAFKIYGGQIHAVEAVFESMPADSPTGWE
jgi:hypothetical protein